MKETEQAWRRRVRAGFTLVEMLLVVAIIGILAGVVVANFTGKQKKAAINATRASIDAIRTAVDMYEVDTGRFPPSLNSLVEKDDAPNWSGPYIRGGIPMDQWGHPFKYTTDGETYKVISDGPPDGQPITSF